MLSISKVYEHTERVSGGQCGGLCQIGLGRSLGFKRTYRGGGPGRPTGEQLAILYPDIVTSPQFIATFCISAKARCRIANPSQPEYVYRRSSAAFEQFRLVAAHQFEPAGRMTGVEPADVTNERVAPAHLGEICIL